MYFEKLGDKAAGLISAELLCFREMHKRGQESLGSIINLMSISNVSLSSESCFKKSCFKSTFCYSGWKKKKSKQ